MGHRIPIERLANKEKDTSCTVTGIKELGVVKCGCL